MVGERDEERKKKIYSQSCHGDGLGHVQFAFVLAGLGDDNVGLSQSPQSAGQSKYFQLFVLGGIHELAPCFEFIMVMYTRWNVFPILFTHAAFTVSCSVDTFNVQ